LSGGNAINMVEKFGINYLKLFAGFVLILTIVLLMAASAGALGVTPARSIMDYSGEKTEVSFMAINSENRDVSVVASVQGELKEYLRIIDKEFILPAKQSRSVRYEVNLPAELAPGLHTAEIVVLQLPEEGSLGETAIGAALAVVSQLHVNVPYPGKYAEADLKLAGPNGDGGYSFVAPVVSRGEFDIISLRATIDVFTSLNEKVVTIETQEVSLASRQRVELVADFDASELSPGPYRAVATIKYDEAVLTVEHNFNLGEKRLVLQNIEVNDFSLGEIAKFELEVENKWGDVARDAYAEIFVYGDGGGILASFKSPTQDIPPLNRAQLIMYGDTAGWRSGTYDAKLSLKYKEWSDEREFKLGENSLEFIGLGYVISKQGRASATGNTLTLVLVVLVGLLILINVSWFLFLRKRLKR